MNAPYYQIDHGLAARKDLRPVDKLIFGIIADHIGDNSNGWPGLTCLQREAAVSRHTVIDAIRRLENAGVLQVLRQGKGKRTRYIIPEVVQKAHQSGAEPAPVKVVQKAHQSGAEPAPDQCRKRTTSGAEPAHEPPYKPPQEPPQEPKALKKPRHRNLFSDQFCKAYLEHYEEPYRPSKDDAKVDFIQLAKLNRDRPDITAERFVAVARVHWERGKYTPGASLTIRGMVAAWGKLAAKAKGLQQRDDKQDCPPTDADHRGGW